MGSKTKSRSNVTASSVSDPVAAPAPTTAPVTSEPSTTIKNPITVNFKIKIPESSTNYYTDIYSHLFCPFGEEEGSASGGSTTSREILVGTSYSELVLIANECKNTDEFAPNLVARIQLVPPPSGYYKLNTHRSKNQKKIKTNCSGTNPILNLDWGQTKNQIFAQTPKSIYKVLISSDSESQLPQSHVIYTKNSMINSFCSLRTTTDPGNHDKLCITADDGSLGILDITTQKIVTQIEDLTGATEVCKARNEFIATAGNHTVLLYDSSLRSPEPVHKFELGGALVNNIALSNTSTWIAITTSSTHTIPSIFNIHTGVQLTPTINEKKCVQQKIYEVQFDENGVLYWGGSSGSVFVSENLDSITREMKTNFGDKEIGHVYSITTQKYNGKIQLSAAGSTNGLILSTNSKYWDTMIHI